MMADMFHIKLKKKKPKTLLWLRSVSQSVLTQGTRPWVTPDAFRVLLFYSELFNPQVSEESLIFYKNLGTLGVAIAALLCFLTNFYTASLVFANREIAPYWSLIGMQVKSAAIQKLLLHFLCLYQICHSGHRNSQAII